MGRTCQRLSLVDDQAKAAQWTRRVGFHVVEASGQGCIARTRSWMAWAGRDQSIRPSSFLSLAALVTFDLS